MIVTYRGRIALLFLSLLTSFFYYVLGNELSLLSLVFSLLHAAVSWVFGGWYDKYRFLSYHDPLTGVYNRRYAHFIFEKKLHQARNRNERLGILLIDVNNFKVINDTYGHDDGDFILKETCRIIQNSMDKKDILIRWGGDEFLVLLTNRDDGDIRKFIHQMNDDIVIARSECEEKNKIFPSLSIGFSCYPKDATKISELISIADKRMYQAKDNAN